MKSIKHWLKHCRDNGLSIAHSLPYSLPHVNSSQWDNYQPIPIRKDMMMKTIKYWLKNYQENWFLLRHIGISQWDVEK